MRQPSNPQLTNTQMEIKISKDSLQRILLHEHSKYRDCRARRCRQDQPD